MEAVAVSEPKALCPLSISEYVIVKYKLGGFTWRSLIFIRVILLEHSASYNEFNVITPTQSGLIRPLMVVSPGNYCAVYMFFD